MVPVAPPMGAGRKRPVMGSRTASTNRKVCESSSGSVCSQLFRWAWASSRWAVPHKLAPCSLEDEVLAGEVLCPARCR